MKIDIYTKNVNVRDNLLDLRVDGNYNMELKETDRKGWAEIVCGRLWPASSCGSWSPDCSRDTIQHLDGARCALTQQLTTLSTVLLQGVTVPQHSKYSPYFLTTDSSLLFSQGQRLVPLLSQMNPDYTIILFLSDPF